MSSARSYPASRRVLMVYTAAAIPIELGLLNLAFWGNAHLTPEMGMPELRLLSVYLPLALSVGTVVLLAYMFYVYSGREIRLTTEGLAYTHHGVTRVVRWDQMTVVTPPPGSKSVLRWALVSDGQHNVRIERALYPSFEELLGALEERRRGRLGQKKVRL